MKLLLRHLALFTVLAPGFRSQALDQNSNQLSDVWEMVYAATGMAPTADFDGDGWTTLDENRAGTDPRDPWSFPSLEWGGSAPTTLLWQAQAGKSYSLLASPSLAADSWILRSTYLASTTTAVTLSITPATDRQFFRLVPNDTDSDGDGLNDWEERAVGFDPLSTRSERRDTLDATRLPGGLSATNTITVSVYDEFTAERWPDPAIIVLRRSGGLQPLTVTVALSGSASANDYAITPALGSGNSVRFGAGQREVFLEIHPTQDVLAVSELAETLTLTAQAGAGYALGSTVSGTITIEADGVLPTEKEASRFLIQAAFGPNYDNDPSSTSNLEAVRQLGIAGWIDQQFARPIGTLQPFVDWAIEAGNENEIYNDKKQDAWWNRAMEVAKLRPDATATQLGDPLRQRIGFALSQIFVISDRMEDLAVDPSGVAQYYDMLLQHSFGNFRDLLRDVSLHPCMGIYLSHMGNRKADPVARTFPDENYAREIMQLFSIGLWELNPDGSRKLNTQGQPIAAYTNADITEFARIFTGLSFGQPDKENFGLWPRDFHYPMAGWDEEHDLTPKTLLRGTITPSRTASTGRTGTATMADVDAAVDNLFNHPNVGPFIGKQLIQRLISSNPSPAYIARVTAAFDNNGSGLRGDMKAVVKAILLDPEARNYSNRANPHYGKLREPFLKCVNLARAFNAYSASGWFYLDAFAIDHVQEPLKSPSVFNFYLPSYSPPGALSQAGLVAPEFQIINATSGTMAPNYFWNAISEGLHRWGVGRSDYATQLNLTQEMEMNVPGIPPGEHDPNIQPLDPDALIRRLDLLLTGGTLTPRNFQSIREALDRIRPGSGWDWPINRLRLAIYLIVTSPEFAVQR